MDRTALLCPSSARGTRLRGGRRFALVAASLALAAGCASTGSEPGDRDASAGTGGTAIGAGGQATGTGGAASVGTGGAGTGGAPAGGTGGARDAGAGTGGLRADAGAGTGGAGIGGTGTGGTIAGGTGGARDAGSDAGAVDGGAVPGVRIVGRTAPGTAGGTRFAWSGTSIQARFTGTQVSMQLNDGSNRNEFAVVVDGTVRAKVVTAPGTSTYPLATGLPAGTHDLVVWRRSEAKYGVSEFVGLTGFGAGGGLAAPAAAPDRRIELVGDSITSGVGIEQTGSCSGTEDNENNYLAYGSVAARAVGADVVTIAWQGIGMYRNYNQAAPVASDPTMPKRYDYAIPNDMTTWDFSKYQPQAVIINLTSNDFSTNGDPGTSYITTYISFIQHVRSLYPSTYFFCVIEYSNGSVSSATDINTIVSMVRAAGDTKIEAFDIRPYANGNACEGHPDIAGGQSMGTALANELTRVLGW